MECDVHNVESDASHVFFSHDGFFGRPLESSFKGVLDFIQVLHSLSLINQQVRASCLRTEAPNLLSIIDVPTIVVSELSVPGLGVFFGGELLRVDVVGEVVAKGLGNDVESVVLVGGLGEASLAGCLSDGLLEGHHWV